MILKILAIIIIIMGWGGERGHGAKILAVAPFPAISHFKMLERLLISLAERGHQVTVISNFPRKEKHPNYTDIDIRGLFLDYNIEMAPWTLVDDMMDIFNYGREHCERFLSTDLFKNFLSTHKHFDLIFLEGFDSDCYVGIAAKYKAPFILYSAMSLPIWLSDWIYNPTQPNYLPDNLCRLAGKMDFYDRLQNFACHVFFRGLYWFTDVKPSLEIVKKHFHLDVDTLEDIKKNVSLIMMNTFHGVTGTRPLLPNVLEVGGIHLKPPKPLPKNIEKFLNESVDGAIVISMGSIIKTHTLDPKIKKGFLSAISKLKERVLWKWEVDLPDKPVNLMTVPWLPQLDVLGHPNVKLFVAHGGIHGLYEAIHHGVPIIGIPIFGDQIANLKTLELQGVAKVINFQDLNEHTFSTAINTILNNSSYKIKMEKLSRIFCDQPQTPLEKAIFWTEYVIRHGGAPHFQSGALELSWLQFALVDVILVCFSFCILFVVVFHYTLKFLTII